MKIRFRGGPLNGKVRDVELCERSNGLEFPPYLSVPVKPPREMRRVDRAINPSELTFTKVDYRLVRVGREYWDMEYHAG